MSNVADDSVFATEIELPPPFFLNVTLSPVLKGWLGKKILCVGIEIL